MMMIKEIKTGRRGTRPRRAADTSGRRPPRRRTPRRGRRACADQTLRRRPRRWRVSAQSRCQVKYQRKSLGRRDAHARVAGDLAPPLPADDAGVLRRPRRPGAAGLRLGPGEREARELRGDVYVGVALRRIATLALQRPVQGQGDFCLYRVVSSPVFFVDYLSARLEPTAKR